MERAKAYERLNRYEEAIESYARTIIRWRDLYALRIGKCHEKGNSVLALQFYNETVHEDYLTKDGLLLLILCASKKLSKALF
jgi:hypothetical protein